MRLHTMSNKHDFVSICEKALHFMKDYYFTKWHFDNCVTWKQV